MFERDEHILAHWDDEYWYPARINAVRGARYEIVFDDGDLAEYDASRIVPLDWDAGARVQGNWQGQGRYYPAVIESREHLRVSLAYDDGDTEVTSIGRCRSIEPTPIALPGEW